MNKWGYGLLIAYVALGVSGVRWHKAMRLAALLTVVGIAYAVHGAGVV